MKITAWRISSTIVGCFVLASVVALIWFSTRSLPVDNSILSQTPCKFPCWHSLVPNQSTTADVEKLIATDPFVAVNHVQKDVDTAQSVTIFTWWYTHPMERNSITMINNVVSSIHITPNLKFTLRDILALYGNPESISIQPQRDSDNWGIRVYVALYYPQLGLIVRVTYPNFQPILVFYPLEADMIGADFYGFPSSTTLTDFLENVRISKGTDFVVPENILKWPGLNARFTLGNEKFPPQALTATPLSE
jgi:hypothetical protein